MSTYEVHEIANLFPLMSPEEFDRLKASIDAHGLLEAILLFEGKVIDGRHRYRACRELGVVGRFEQFSGDHDEAIARTLALNFHRRHLTTVQRAALGVGLKQFETEKAGGASREVVPFEDFLTEAPAPVPVQTMIPMGEKAPAEEKKAPVEKKKTPAEPIKVAVAMKPPAADSAPNPSLTPEDIASDRLGVSVRAIRNAEKIKREAPDVFTRMLTDVAGSMGDAQRVAKLPLPTRSKIHDEVDRGASVKDAIKKIVPPIKKATPDHMIKLSGRVILSAEEGAGWSSALKKTSLTEKQAIEAALKAWIRAQVSAEEKK